MTILEVQYHYYFMLYRYVFCRKACPWFCCPQLCKRKNTYNLHAHISVRQAWKPMSTIYYNHIIDFRSIFMFFFLLFFTYTVTAASSRNLSNQYCINVHIIDIINVWNYLRVIKVCMCLYTITTRPTIIKQLRKLCELSRINSKLLQVKLNFMIFKHISMCHHNGGQTVLFDDGKISQI